MTLKHLTLISAGIGDLAMVEIAKGIQEAICLEFIDLRHNHFERVGFEALITALKSTMACKVLYLEGFHLEMIEARLLTDFLKQPGCLLGELDLVQAELDYNVLEHLVAALSKCKRLNSVNFSKNNLAIDEVDLTDDSDASFVSEHSH